MGWIIGLLAFFGFLFFLIKFPRQILTGVGIIIGGIALLIYIFLYLPEENRKKFNRKSLLQSPMIQLNVELTIHYLLSLTINLTRQYQKCHGMLMHISWDTVQI